MKTTFDTKTMSPWHELNRMLSNVRSLKVKAGGKTYEGQATLEDAAGDGHLVLEFAKVKAKVKARVKGKK